MDATPDPPSPAEPESIAGTRVYRASPRTRRQLLIVFSLVMLLPVILVVAGLAGGDRGILIAEQRYMPLGMFAYWLRYGDLAT